MTTLFLQLVVLVQLVTPPGNRIAQADLLAKGRSDDTPAVLAQLRKAEFERRYQAMVAAMNAFSEKYNASNGQLWPLKEANALRKALRELRDIEPSLDPDRRLAESK